MSLLIANKLKSGNKRKVVAVLLVNSVSKEVVNVTKRIIKIKFKLPIISIVFENSLAKPVEIINEAMARPPPKRSKTFQGTFLYQSNDKINLLFLHGIIKNKIDPKIAITESVSLI